MAPIEEEHTTRIYEKSGQILRFNKNLFILGGIIMVGINESYKNSQYVKDNSYTISSVNRNYDLASDIFVLSALSALVKFGDALQKLVNGTVLKAYYAGKAHCFTYEGKDLAELNANRNYANKELWGAQNEAILAAGLVIPGVNLVFNRLFKREIFQTDEQKANGSGEWTVIFTEDYLKGQILESKKNPESVAKNIYDQTVRNLENANNKVVELQNRIREAEIKINAGNLTAEELKNAKIELSKLQSAHDSLKNENKQIPELKNQIVDLKKQIQTTGDVSELQNLILKQSERIEGLDKELGKRPTAEEHNKLKQQLLEKEVQIKKLEESNTQYPIDVEFERKVLADKVQLLKMNQQAIDDTFKLISEKLLEQNKVLDPKKQKNITDILFKMTTTINKMRNDYLDQLINSLMDLTKNKDFNLNINDITNSRMTFASKIDLDLKTFQDKGQAQLDNLNNISKEAKRKHTFDTISEQVVPKSELELRIEDIRQSKEEMLQNKIIDYFVKEGKKYDLSEEDVKKNFDVDPNSYVEKKEKRKSLKDALQGLLTKSPKVNPEKKEAKNPLDDDTIIIDPNAVDEKKERRLSAGESLKQGISKLFTPKPKTGDVNGEEIKEGGGNALQKKGSRKSIKLDETPIKQDEKKK